MIDASAIISACKQRADSEKKRKLAEYYRNFGLANDGTAYVSLEYAKEKTDAAMKTGKAKYMKGLGICSPTPIEGLRMVKMDVSRFVVWDERMERYRLDVQSARLEMSEAYRDGLSKDEIGNGFVGRPGERLTLKVRYLGYVVSNKESDFGRFHTLFFADKDGHRVAWRQRNYAGKTVEKFCRLHGEGAGNTVTVVGSVVSHRTTHGRMNTFLKRCEIFGKDGGAEITLCRFAEMNRSDGEIVYGTEDWE